MPCLPACFSASPSACPTALLLRHASATGWAPASASRRCRPGWAPSSTFWSWSRVSAVLGWELRQLWGCAGCWALQTPPAWLPCHRCRLQRGGQAYLPPGGFCLPARLCRHPQLLRCVSEPRHWCVTLATATSRQAVAHFDAPATLQHSCMPGLCCCWCHPVRLGSIHSNSPLHPPPLCMQWTTCPTSWAARRQPPVCGGWRASPRCCTSFPALAGWMQRWAGGEAGGLLAGLPI